MKKMILNTIIIYLIGLGIVIGIACLGFVVEGFSTQGKLAAVILAFAGGYFTVATVSVVVGWRAGCGKADMVTAIVFSILIGVAWLYLMRYDMKSTSALWAISPLALVLLSFTFSKLIGYTNGFTAFAHFGAKVGVAFVLFIIFYLIGAYQSTWSWLALPQELFFSQPQNSRVEFHGSRDENDNYILCTDDTNEPFTGEIISYKNRLKLNFFIKNPGGIGYYIDGCLFGNSGDVILPGNHNSWYGTDEYFDRWKYSVQNKQGQEYLLHNSYQEMIEKEFPAGAALFYAEQGSIHTNGNVSDLPKIVVIYNENKKLVRKEISFQKNGVIDRIDFYSAGKDGWKYYNSFFDNLAFSKYCDYDFYQERPWSVDDFEVSNFDAYEYIKASSKIAALISDTPDKMAYVPFPKNWKDDGNLVDNLIAVYGFPVTTVSCMVWDNDSKFEYMNVEDGNDMLSLIGLSTLKFNFLETDNDIYDLQQKSTHFRIYSESGNEYINLYFKENKLLIEDGPYYLDLVNERENDSEEDTSRRKELYQKFLESEIVSTAPTEAELNYAPKAARLWDGVGGKPDEQ